MLGSCFTCFALLWEGNGNGVVLYGMERCGVFGGDREGSLQCWENFGVFWIGIGCLMISLIGFLILVIYGHGRSHGLGVSLRVRGG